jgi:hypothetical protein
MSQVRIREIPKDIAWARILKRKERTEKKQRN